MYEKSAICRSFLNVLAASIETKYLTVLQRPLRSKATKEDEKSEFLEMSKHLSKELCWGYCIDLSVKVD